MNLHGKSSYMIFLCFAFIILSLFPVSVFIISCRRKKTKSFLFHKKIPLYAGFFLQHLQTFNNFSGPGGIYFHIGGGKSATVSSAFSLSALYRDSLNSIPACITPLLLIMKPFSPSSFTAKSTSSIFLSL